LDKVYALNENIQAHLYEKIRQLNLDDYELVFYDITSSYFQQSKCSIVRYGLSRDHRRDKKQIVLALAVTKKGFPFYWKVLPGNTADTKTVKDFVSEIKTHFKVKKTCLVMDKGMVSKTNLDKINLESLNYVVTVRKNTINKISDMPWSYLKSINEKNVDRKKDYFIYHSKRTYYKELKPQENKRYILCFNPEKFLQERKDRLEKIESIKKYLDKRNKKLLQSKRKKNRALLREEIKNYFKKRGAHNIFIFRLIARDKTFHISYSTIDKAIREAARFDGIYVIMSNVKKAAAEELIEAYRNRMEIERTFHQLKSYVELRPVYHRNEERIKAHVTICVLGYLLNHTVTHLSRQKKDFEELTGAINI